MISFECFSIPLSSNYYSSALDRKLCSREVKIFAERYTGCRWRNQGGELLGAGF
jgi:hypothetical protein